MSDPDIESEVYGRAIDALIDAIPTDPYGLCPCGCGCKFKFVKSTFDDHEKQYVTDYIAKETNEINKD